MNAENISAEGRGAFGKGSARKIRAAGSIPAVVYRDGNAASHITLDPAEIEGVFRRSNDRNTLVAIDADGQSRTCLVKDVQRHPLSQKIMHMDFYEVSASEDVRVEVNIVPVGIPAGVKLGGRLRILRRTVVLTCKPADIPSVIEADVSEVSVGKFLKLSDVPTPKGTQFVNASDFNLYTVIGKRVEE
jgi:large subunit ribosomal protein L25